MSTTVRAGVGLQELLAEATAGLGTDEVPGVVAVAVHGERTAVLCRGRLRRGSPAPVTAETRFEIGSLSKLFTTLLLAEGVGRGEVRFEDPVASYLGAGGGGGGGGPTLLDLAAHSAGLPRQPYGFYRSAGLRLLKDPYARYTREQLYAAALRALDRTRPGEVRYSTFGAALLGQLLADRAGLPYAQLLAERVLRPLGLERTAAAGLHGVPGAAVGHRRGRPVRYWTFQGLAPAGAVHSTGSDLLRFLRVQLAPEPAPLGLTEAVRATQAPRRPVPGGTDEMCLGWNRRQAKGRTRYWHTGGTGGFTGYLAFSPGEGGGAGAGVGVGVAVLANATPTRRQPVLAAGRAVFRELLRT